MSDMYELYAIRYAWHERRSGQVFVLGDPHDRPMPLNYYVWAIVGSERTFILDTGFDAAMAEKRGRHLLQPVAEGLKSLNIDHATVSDVIISHMHYDHCGNHPLFPKARFHLQDEEMNYCTGRCMCHRITRMPFEVDDVTNMIGRVFQGRVCFHDGESEVAPGITVHKVGGHTRGLQIVRVKTQRGYVVLGSDAAHFYANMEREDPFPVFDSISEVLEGNRTMRRLATSPDHIIPGHDPLVMERYPAARKGLEHVVRLDVEPAAM